MEKTKIGHLNKLNGNMKYWLHIKQYFPQSFELISDFIIDLNSNTGEQKKNSELLISKINSGAYNWYSLIGYCRSFFEKNDIFMEAILASWEFENIDLLQGDRALYFGVISHVVDNKIVVWHEHREIEKLIKIQKIIVCYSFYLLENHLNDVTNPIKSLPFTINEIIAE